jgi:hypothetical protein
MRNLLAFLAALTLTVGGLGWYLDWFRVRSEPAPEGQRGLSIDINTSKIGADLHRGEQNLQKIIEGAGKEGSGEPERKPVAKGGRPGPRAKAPARIDND